MAELPLAHETESAIGGGTGSSGTASACGIESETAFWISNALQIS